MTLDHVSRLALARETLDGLSVGDALGEMMSYQHHRARERQDLSDSPPGALRYTDDTAMALAVVECLGLCRGIDGDALAWVFGRNFQSDPDRGYGKMTRRMLGKIANGAAWRKVADASFGTGSFGNGSAMRVGPVGAYFCDDLMKTREMAAASARVTHTHPEGVAGAIAVAVACAVATNRRKETSEQVATAIWEQVLIMTPDGSTARALRTARSFEPTREPSEVASAVGCGFEVSCQDTVPFAIWNACRCLHDYREGLLSTIQVGGDCDTNSAIVGAIIASHCGAACIPQDWRRAREPLPK